MSPVTREEVNDILTVVDYYLDQATDDTRPDYILLAMCRIK